MAVQAMTPWMVAQAPTSWWAVQATTPMWWTTSATTWWRRPPEALTPFAVRSAAPSCPFGTTSRTWCLWRAQAIWRHRAMPGPTRLPATAVATSWTAGGVTTQFSAWLVTTSSAAVWATTPWTAEPGRTSWRAAGVTTHTSPSTRATPSVKGRQEAWTPSKQARALTRCPTTSNAWPSPARTT